GLPSDVREELARSAEPRMAPALEARLAEASRAYEADRYKEAQQALADLVRKAPESAAVRELYGLCLYRRGRWGEAIRELEAFHRLGGSMDQHPVLADCHRALGHGKDVRRLWEELREGSPSGEVVAEGRIVMAETLAEEGDLGVAIALLERSLRPHRVVRDHHVRQWYALADLYERAGELGRARALFARVLDHDAELSDTAERLAALG
ncbi:MAG: tetratricopeptide repeat protein, partial [Acidimicrobiales bacterium]